MLPVMSAHFFLYLLSPTLIISSILIGSYRRDDDIWLQALALLFVVMLWNTWLKAFFAIPLQAPLKGFAFPSGHMHAACVFWGMVVCRYWRQSKAISALILVSMPIYGWALIYNHYHNLTDVLAAVAFSVVEIYLFRKYLAFWQNSPWAICQKCSVYIVPWLVATMFLLVYHVHAHAWFAQGALTGIVCCSMLPKQNVKRGLDWLLLTLAGIGLIYIVSVHLGYHPRVYIALDLCVLVLWMFYFSDRVLLHIRRMLQHKALARYTKWPLTVDEN